MENLLVPVPLPLAALSDVSGPDGAVPRIQLLPDGEFAARDGRPGNLKQPVARWKLDASIAAALLDRWRGRATPLVVDYDHQSLHSRENGQPAPAAGWIGDLTYVPGKGLFAAVSWTERARAHIQADEYRYISPTISYDPDTGAVLELKSAALTNIPALDGMDAVAASETPMEPCMDKKKLKILLGLPDDADDAALDAALAELSAACKGADGAAVPLTEHLATLRDAAAKDPDPTRFMPVALLAAEQQKVAALSARVKELEGKTAQDGLKAEIRAALADGRLPKSCEAWACNTAASHPDALRAYLQAAAPVAALTTMQSAGKEPDGGKTASLTDEERYACSVAGLSAQEFLEQKAKEHEKCLL